MGGSRGKAVSPYVSNQAIVSAMSWFDSILQSITKFNAEHFVNPTFVLPGLALVSAPIIIHFINRLRYQRVRFAAMEFLLKSRERNRRRLLLEQLLLLLLRIGVIILLVGLIARMELNPERLSIFRGAAKAHHLVLLDDSGSMRDRWGETSAIDEAVNIIKKLNSEGSRRPDTQKFTLLLLSNPDEPVVLARDINEQFAKELDARLETLRRRCTHQALDLARGMDAARKLLAGEKGAIQHLHVISDFRLVDWQNPGGLRSTVASLDEAGVTVNLVRTVPDQHENLAVTELSGDVQVAAAGVPLRLKVAVKNLGRQLAKDVRLSVIQDGQKLPFTIHFDKIEPGGDVMREFDVTFASPKKHKLQVGLEGDALASDNFQYLAVDIASTNPVLIIDGDPQSDEASYVADALSAAPGLTGLAPVVEQVDYLRRHPLDRFQCIYLINVAELPPDALEPLEEYVHSGGGLAWFLGDTVNVAFYNDKLHRQGEGLFPLPLAPGRRELPQADEVTPGPDIEFATHPVFRIFEGEDNSFVRIVTVDSYLAAADNWIRDDNRRKDRVTTIGTLRNGQPVFFEHRFGEGRVFTSLTSAGPMWNSWARNRSYPIFQMELEKYLARSEGAQERRTVGQPIDIAVDPTLFTENVEISAPEEAGQRITRLQAAPDPTPAIRHPDDADPAADAAEKDVGNTAGDGASRTASSAPKVAPYRAVYRDTDTPGVYAVKLIDKDQVPSEQWLAYNVPLNESELALAANQQIIRQLGNPARLHIQEAGNLEWIQGADSNQEIKHLLLFALLAFLVVEQLLALKFSHHPKTAGALA